MITGCYIGAPYVCWGSNDGLKKPQQLLDRKGGLMHTGRYWDVEKGEHTSGDGPGGRAYSAYPFDWDGDGDLDLIVGNDKGGIYLRINEGTTEKHAFATTVKTVRARKDAAMVPSGYAMPIPVDWDGDGRFDLVSGAKDGSVWWFRNVGKAGKPRFERERQLIARASGARQAKAQIDVVDFDGDGDLDILVGDEHPGRESHGHIWLFRRAGRPGASPGTR